MALVEEVREVRWSDFLRIFLFGLNPPRYYPVIVVGKKMIIGDTAFSFPTLILLGSYDPAELEQKDLGELERMKRETFEARAVDIVFSGFIDPQSGRLAWFSGNPRYAEEVEGHFKDFAGWPA